MDSDLNLNSRVKSVTSETFYHLKNITIKGVVLKLDLERLIEDWRLYCNGQSERAVKQLEMSFAQVLMLRSIYLRGQSWE